MKIGAGHLVMLPALVNLTTQLNPPEARVFNEVLEEMVAEGLFEKVQDSRGPNLRLTEKGEQAAYYGG
jgi:predicted transcriptional regulator